MQERPRILIAETDDFSPEVIQQLRQLADVNLGMEQVSDLKEALDHYDVFWFRLGYRIDDTVLTQDSRCKILATPVTGIDHIDEELCARLGVKIICLRGEREFLREVRATAEMAVGLAIALMRHIPRAATSVLKGKWDRDSFRGHELFQKVVGIIGFGRLGQITADYFAALGMKVIFYDPHLKDKEYDYERRKNLADLLRQSDLISLHVSYTMDTHHLLDTNMLAHCKKGAYLVNTSRGGIVDELALLDALNKRQLAGAALDVIQGEPEIADHPLVEYARAHSNLLIVPHIGGNTYESFTKTERFIANKVIAHVSRC